MDYNDIKKLIDDMGDSKIDELEIEFPEGIKISMKKNMQKEVVVTGGNVIEASAPMTVPVVTTPKENSLVNVENKKEENLKIVKSPMVGTFYAKSSPKAEPFVNPQRERILMID